MGDFTTDLSERMRHESDHLCQYCDEYDPAWNGNNFSQVSE